jgi:hypothetical protein
MKYRPISKLCSRGCGRERRSGQRLCAECHAAMMRGYRHNRLDRLDQLRAEIARLRAEIQELRRERV